MKIRRKLPKPARAAPPGYLVGYTIQPAFTELQSWFDLEYGGPITFKEAGTPDSVGSGSRTVAAHGPWQAILTTALPATDADAWKQRLEWRHETCGGIWAATATRGTIIDTVLHTARLARGLTLLTEGTAYDVATERYLNPSDWIDRPLTGFLAPDHVTVVQSEDAQRDLDWFYTRGLNKFGLDDLEVFRPPGLAVDAVTERLFLIVGELLHRGHSPGVGTTLAIPQEDMSIQVVRHRTIPSSDKPLVLREIVW